MKKKATIKYDLNNRHLFVECALCTLQIESFVPVDMVTDVPRDELVQAFLSAAVGMLVEHCDKDHKGNTKYKVVVIDSNIFDDNARNN